MSFNLFKFGLRGHKAKVTYTPNPKASLERRIGRMNRVEKAIERAVKRGDARKAGRLQEELDALTENLLEEKADIEAMLRASNKNARLD